MKTLFCIFIVIVSVASFSTSATAESKHSAHFVQKLTVPAKENMQLRKSKLKLQLNASRMVLNAQDRLVSQSQSPIAIETSVLTLNNNGKNTTAITWTCTSDTPVGQDECGENANNLAIDSDAVCGSIEGGYECVYD